MVKIILETWKQKEREGYRPMIPYLAITISQRDSKIKRSQPDSIWKDLPPRDSENTAERKLERHGANESLAGLPTGHSSYTTRTSRGKETTAPNYKGNRDNSSINEPDKN